MDTFEQVMVETASHRKRQRRSIEEKRRIVEETLEAGASVARVALRHGINANQLFSWRKKYREGRLGKTSQLLPVRVSEIPCKSGDVGSSFPPSAAGSMEIKLSKGQLRVTGRVEIETLRTVLECLLG